MTFCVAIFDLFPIIFNAFYSHIEFTYHDINIDKENKTVIIIHINRFIRSIKPFDVE